MSEYSGHWIKFAFLTQNFFSTIYLFPIFRIFSLIEQTLQQTQFCPTTLKLTIWIIILIEKSLHNCLKIISLQIIPVYLHIPSDWTVSKFCLSTSSLMVWIFSLIEQSFHKVAKIPFMYLIRDDLDIRSLEQYFYNTENSVSPY